MPYDPDDMFDGAADEERKRPTGDEPLGLVVPQRADNSEDVQLWEGLYRDAAPEVGVAFCEEDDNGRETFANLAAYRAAGYTGPANAEDALAWEARITAEREAEFVARLAS